MKPIYTKNRTIGILGGSFNPAHAGHLHISEHALKMGLDQVWWLVSPQNPLKEKADMAAYSKRLESARLIAKHNPRIVVSDIENAQGLYYTCDTLDYLARRYPGTHFVWMMGADNLAQFHRWRGWHTILMRFPILVFDRAPFSHRATRSRAAIRAHGLASNNMGINGAQPAFALRFVRLPKSPVSATELRKTLGKAAFL